MVDQTLPEIQAVQTENKARKLQKDYYNKAVEAASRLEHDNLIKLVEDIEAIFEQKYGKDKAEKLILQDNEVSNRYRTGIDKCRQMALLQNDSKKTASNVYKNRKNVDTFESTSTPFRHPGVEATIYIYQHLQVIFTKFESKSVFFTKAQ